jgi:uncharacterized membrane protein (Fun14 family)
VSTAPNIVDELIKILSGHVPNVSLFVLLGYAFLSIPLVIGLILGFTVKKAFKIVIIAIVIVASSLYFGILTMSDLRFYLQAVKGFGPEVMHYAAILFTMLPLGIGFTIGFIIGLKLG